MGFTDHLGPFLEMNNLRRQCLRYAQGTAETLTKGICQSGDAQARLPRTREC